MENTENDFWSRPEEAVEPEPQFTLNDALIRISELEAHIEVLKAEREQIIAWSGENTRKVFDLATKDLLLAKKRGNARIAELEAALQPFAAEAARWHESFADGETLHCLIVDMPFSGDTLAAFNLADLRRAAAKLLAPTE